MSDVWQEPTTKRWIEHVLEDMVPKMEGSALVCQLVPDDREGDVKFWVELGASICFDKPIVAVVFGDTPIPRKLELVADEVVRCPRGVDHLASEEMAAAMRRVLSADRDGGYEA